MSHIPKHQNCKNGKNGKNGPNDLSKYRKGRLHLKDKKLAKNPFQTIFGRLFFH